MSNQNFEYMIIFLVFTIMIINIGLSLSVIKEYDNALKTEDIVLENEEKKNTTNEEKNRFKEVLSEKKKKIEEVFKIAVFCLPGSLFVIIMIIIINIIKYYKFKGSSEDIFNYNKILSYIIIGLLGLIILITFICSLIIIGHILFGVLHTHFYSNNYVQFVMIALVLTAYFLFFTPVLIYLIPLIIASPFLLLYKKQQLTIQKNKTTEVPKYEIYRP